MKNVDSKKLSPRPLYLAVRLAAQLGDIEIIRLFLDHQDYVNTVNRDSLSALHLAVQAGRADLIQTPLEYNASPALLCNKLPDHSAVSPRFYQNPPRERLGDLPPFFLPQQSEEETKSPTKPGKR